jgi:hypothetical protein
MMNLKFDVLKTIRIGTTYQQIFVLCYTLSRDMFDNTVFFQSDALCMKSANEFYGISQVSSQLVAA